MPQDVQCEGCKAFRPRRCDVLALGPGAGAAAGL